MHSPDLVLLVHDEVELVMRVGHSPSIRRGCGNRLVLYNSYNTMLYCNYNNTVNPREEGWKQYA